MKKGWPWCARSRRTCPRDLIGDPTRLRQVLLNLLGNAIKFTESGEVALRVTPDADSSVPGALRFTISDTGIGIPDEKLGAVFERFTQADSSTTRRYGGSGLGLTISKRLVELMGGRIWVESGVGKGSVFSFAVPLEIWAGATRRAAVPVGTDPEPPLPALHILLVEDSPDNRTITMAYLQDTPYRVEIAENGAIACEKFTAGHYDLVLMDRQMPVMDGLTATRAIREWEQANHRPPTPIIALTASALKGDQEKCRGGRVHGVFDETDQARGAAAGDQGAFHGRASVIEGGEQPEGHDPCACESQVRRPDPRVSAEPQAGCHRDAGRPGSG